MDRLRAQEIAESPDFKNVQYKGKKVYIQRISEDSDTARIYYLDDPQNEIEVQLSDLREKM
ncbi:H-type small acid-soluble spore protein [Bacillaceae bacterium W0354]